MFGCPESNEPSLDLLAYASGYLRTYYRPAFICALLNNQPMGFYHPSTLIKDAQRHGLRVLPVNINRSRVKCSLEDFQLRLGFRYVRGLRGGVAKTIEEAQPFCDIEDLAGRVPELNKEEMMQLASIGALNSIGAEHRRNALWRASEAVRRSTELLVAG